MSSHQALPSFLRRVSLPLAAAVTLTLGACGGGGSDEASVAVAQPLDAPVASAAAVDTVAEADAKAGIEQVKPVTKTLTDGSNTLQVASQLPGFPHSFDVYRPAGATKVILFLHGLGGYSFQIANDLGLNSVVAPPTMATVNWTWLQQNHIIAIFPQATIPKGSTKPTWSDYIQHSGADDVGFLKALSAYAKTTYGATEVSISGHSDGGAMTSRMWCEATTSFKAFVTLSGPQPSTAYPNPAPECTPLSKAPYYAVVGGADTALAQFTPGGYVPTNSQLAAGLDDPIVVSEWIRDGDRSQRICGAKVSLTPTAISTHGPSWSSCNGQVRYQVVTQANHPIASLEQFMGVKMVDLITQFVQ